MAQPARAVTPKVTDRSTAGALLRYRCMAYVVGVMLIIVFASIPFDAVEKVVGPLHGLLYIVYLATVVEVFVRLRVGLLELIAMVAGGWVPILAFVVERWIRRRVSAGAAGPLS